MNINGGEKILMKKRIRVFLMFTTFLFIISFYIFCLQISVEAAGWGFSKNPNHLPPEIGKYADVIKDTNSYYIGDEKNIYLTFDAGYDNGNLEGILDVLKNKKVKATFFVTGDFVNRFSDLTKRMVEEGHIVANHSYSHRSITSLNNEELASDLSKLENDFKNVTGVEMVKVFRPPKGEFDRKSLISLKELGYKTVFWSIAYADWAKEHQRGKDYSYTSVINNLHPGAIILMHTVSTSNKEALPDIIDEIRKQGYEFSDVTKLC